MRCRLLVILLLLPVQVLLAQVRVKIIIRHLPAASTDSVYIAGNFNHWNPKGLLIPAGKSGTTIEVPPGMTEYKFTRGSWATVETGANGESLINRQFRAEHDTTIEVDILQWADKAGSSGRKPQPSTASENVHIVDTAFYIPQLNRYRRIWIYLPKNYHQSRKKYPVLYMHDGQNVFDAATSFSDEWGVDEAMDQRADEMIVVAIDNGGEKRLQEYAPYDMERYGKGEGNLYLDFIVQTLRPYINTHYRTYTSARHTFIAGSSMGGLISFQAILRYPKVFGAAGVFSPAFWINPAFFHLDEKQIKKVKSRIYLFAGQRESERMVPDMLQVFEQMRAHSKAEINTVIRAEGTHSEQTWRSEFPFFLNWLLKS